MKSILEHLHWWALASMFVVLGLLFTIAMFAPESGRHYAVQNDGNSISKEMIVEKRNPASEEPGALRIQGDGAPALAPVDIKR